MKPPELQVIGVTGARQLWRPRLAELPEQCVSCPFREGNKIEWAGVAAKLAAAGGKSFVDFDCVRALVKLDVSEMGGEFHCHQTVYTDKMMLKPLNEHRQCPGASRYWREGK
jgi:hypothetical protein